jgi:replicative DNA helicase
MPDTSPSDANAERAVVAACLFSAEASVEACELLRPSDFYDGDLATCFEAVGKALKTGAEPTYAVLCSLVENDRQRGLLLTLTDGLPDIANQAHYAKRVLDAGTRRALNRLAIALKAGSENTDTPVGEIVEAAHVALIEAVGREVEGGPRRIGPIAHQEVEVAMALRRGEMKPEGIATQFYRLNAMTGGFHPGELTIIAARPGVGKTVMLINLAYEFARLGTKAVVFSLEMRDRALVARMLAAKTGINSRAFRTGGYLNHDREADLVVAADEMDELPLWVDERPRQTPAAMRMAATRMHMQGQLGAIFIDYLGLVRPSEVKREDRAQALSQITADVREMAKALKVPVIAAHQLSRKAEDRAEGNPQLSDLKDSGGVEEHADCVIFLHRDQRKADRLTRVIVAKQREGPVGDIRLLFEPEYCRFRNYDPEQGG